MLRIARHCVKDFRQKHRTRLARAAHTKLLNKAEIDRICIYMLVCHDFASCWWGLVTCEL